MTRNDSDKSLLSCSGSCFSLAGNFPFPGNRREVWTEHLVHIACSGRWHCHHNTLHWFVARSRVAQVMPSIKYHSISCFAPCLTTCQVHPAFCPLFHCPLLLLRSPAQAQGWSLPEFTAQIHKALEVTAVRIQNLPNWLSTTRSSLKRVRFQKLRTRAKSWYTIRSHYHITSRCCLRLEILWKALLCTRKQTWTTNKFVLCWLHHDISRSEKQVRNDSKFITLKENVWCQVHHKVWTSSAQGNLWHGSHIRKDWVQTNFQKESNLLIF